MTTKTLTGESDNFSETAVGMIKGKLAQSAEVNTALQRLLDNTCYLQKKTEYSNPTIRGSELSIVADYELVTLFGSYFLRNKAYKTFSRVARAVGAADSEFGWTWVNRLKLGGSNDENTTIADCLRLNHGAVATQWNGFAKDSPLRYVTYSNNGGALDIVARVRAPTASTNSQIAGILVVQDSDTSKYQAIWLGYIGSAFQVESWNGASVLAALSSTIVQTDAAWLRIHINERMAATYYSTSTSATPPTSWTFLQSSIGIYDFGRSLRAGQIISGSTSFAADWLYYDVVSPAGLYDAANPCWAAQGYAASTAQQILTDWDIGGRVLNQQMVRTVFSSIVNRLDGDSADVEISIVGSDTLATATPGTYYDPNAIVTPASGRYISAWVRMVSDGFQHGSLALPCELGSL